MTKLLTPQTVFLIYLFFLIIEAFSLNYAVIIDITLIWEKYVFSIILIVLCMNINGVTRWKADQ